MSSAILADKRDNADSIFEIVKRAYTNLPDAIKPTTKTDTKRMYQFTHNYIGEILDSSIYVALHLRSGTVRNLHITESAYIKDRTELVAGSKQAVPINGRISEETTGNGFGEFYDFYNECDQKQGKIGELDYKTYFYGWNINPEYTLETAPLDDKDEYEIKLQNQYKLTDGQLAWRRWKKNELKKENYGFGLSGEQLFRQEYPISKQEAFQSGAGTVFDIDRIMQIRAPHPLSRQDGINALHEGDPKILQSFNTLYNMQTKFWKLPELNKDYVIGVDPSDGNGADYGVIDVWEKDSIGQVAQFYGKVRPDELAEITAELGRFYNNALSGVENNMLTTVLFLSKIYDNYYYETKVDERTLKKTKKIGWNTNTKTRDLMIDEFMILFDEGSLTIRSQLTLNEMKTFVKNEQGKREHAVGKHDDSLFAAFIAIQMRRAWRGQLRTFARKPF